MTASKHIAERAINDCLNTPVTAGRHYGWLTMKTDIGEIEAHEREVFINGVPLDLSEKEITEVYNALRDVFLLRLPGVMDAVIP